MGNPYRTRVLPSTSLARPVRKWVIAVEPSMFRRDETYVLGPFGRCRAWLAARWEVARHPYGEVLVVPATARIEQGRRVLWPKEA